MKTPTEVAFLRLAHGAALALVLAAFSGCGHPKSETRMPPPQAIPPAPQVSAPANSQAAGSYAPTPTVTPPPRISPTPVPPGGVSAEDVDFVATHRPILSEEGLATWYTAPYKGRRAANGQVFDDHAMTAAHRTLPMGSLIEVTNLKTGQSGIMRVADRGPFVDGRIVDLTIASAKVTGVYGAGLVRVRVDVYQTPKSIAKGGRWCVQIGAFKSEVKARKLKKQLMARYPESNVIEFPGENSFWVRIRPEGDNREMAEFIAKHLCPAEGEAFLTRLD
jgi:rare lipoprotein A